MVSIIIYALVVGLDLGHNYEFHMVYSIWALIIFAILFFSELRCKGFSLPLMFLVGAFMRLAIPSLSMSFEEMDGERFVFAKDFTDYVFPTIIGMNVYYMLFLILLTKFAKNKELSFNFDIITKIRHIKLFAIILFVIGTISTIIEVFPFFDLMRGYLSQLSLVALLLLSFYCAYKDDRKTLILFYVLIALNVLVALFFGFYKSKVILPIATYALYYYLYSRNHGKKILNTQFIISVILLVAFLFGFVYPFMSLKREETGWDPSTNEVVAQYSNIEFMQRVIRGETRFQQESNEDKTSAVSDRQNAIPQNSFFYMIARTRGFDQTLLKEAFSLGLPRWLGGGSSKSNSYSQGYLADNYKNFGTFNMDPTTQSNEYVGLFASAYFWGGWLAVLLMCIFNAWVIGFLFEHTQLHIKNIFSLIVLLSLILASIQCFEEIHDGGIMWAKNNLFLYLLAYLSGKFFGRKKMRKVKVSYEGAN